MALPASVEPLRLQDHLSFPRGLGALARAPHTGAAGGAACGDLIRVSVRASGDRVSQAGFEVKGCGAARAAGSAVVELVEGEHVLRVARLTPADVAGELGDWRPRPCTRPSWPSTPCTARWAWPPGTDRSRSRARAAVPSWP
ncbi:MAG: iron-sulfur cluster assembly scaffold protein [Thermoleophilaceae bacterium]